MSGPEMVEKLRRKRAGFSVIFMSGYTEAAALENARVGKDVVLLNKPFSTDTLVRKISQVHEAAAPVTDKTTSPSA
jgi:FixJ family two-component response regulator